ncbi:MAG: VOC family protein [Candidatus Methylomirabilales bacterium]
MEPVTMIPVKDLEKTRRFYEDVLGFTPDIEIPGASVQERERAVQHLPDPVRRDRAAHGDRLADGRYREDP